MNHRFGNRIAVDLPVTAYTVDYGPIAGRMVNLSQSGAAILCDHSHALKLYAALELGFVLPSQGLSEQIRIEGLVVRKEDNLTAILFMQEMVRMMQRLHSVFDHGTVQTELSARMNEKPMSSAV